MSAKRKLLISLLSLVFVVFAVVATIVVAFSLTQQTITTTLNIDYVVEDVQGSVKATYTIGGRTKNLEPIADAEHVSEDNTELLFKVTDTESVGNLMFPESQIPLTATNNSVIIKYTYGNTGNKHYIASMSFDSDLVVNNMQVEYSIDGVTYSENRYAIVVPANTSNKNYWIKISIKDLAQNASFTGDFKWLLSGCDEQAEDYLSLTSVEFQGSNGSYSASLASTGSYVGELVFPSSVNGDPVTTIETSGVTNGGAPSYNNDARLQVTSVYIPDSVEIIADWAFSDFQNLQTVTFEQNETGTASVQGDNGLQTVGFHAFHSCVKLVNFVFPDTVEVIGEEAFYGCDNLVSVKIPASTHTIGGDLTYRCPKVTTIEIANENPVYSSAGNCIINKTTKTLEWGIKTTIIPDDANLVTTIGSCAFYHLEGFTTINIPDNITTMDGGTFAGCEELTTVVIGENVNYMYGSFSGCPSLQSVTFKNPKGWKAGSEEISEQILSDPITAAQKCLEYQSGTWTRS